MDVQIRSYRLSDVFDLEKEANNPRIARTVRDSFPSPYTFKSAEAWIANCRDADRSSSPTAPLHWAIALNDTLIGGIGAVPDRDVYRYNAEVGYWLGEEHWGKGYATDALRLMTRWLFEHTALHRLYAGVFSFNVASMRVLNKAGFEQEAIHKQAIYKESQFWDEHYFVKFRSEHPME
jgi:[ribosomal protein S5]-alanine N-acetyltransferase